MARTFTGTSGHEITTGLGAGASLSTKFTLAGIVRPTSFASNSGFGVTVLCIGVNATGRWTLACTSGGATQIGNNGGQSNSSTTTLSTNKWYFIAVSRPAGTNPTTRHHIYDYAAGTWTHENGTGNTSEQTPGGGSSKIGGFNSGFDIQWNGQIAVAGMNATNLTDAQVEEMAFDLNGWWVGDPKGLWVLDQSATTMKVRDLTGNGADESAIVGTAVSTLAVPVFSYGAPVQVGTHPAAAAQSAALSPADVTVTPQVLGASPGTVSAALTPSTVTVTPQALAASPGTASVALTPSTVTVTPAALTASPGAASAALTAAEIVLTAVALGASPGTVELALSPALIQVVAATLTLVDLGTGDPGCIHLTLSDLGAITLTLSDVGSIALSVEDCP